ncbi:MAG: FAD/NAD(P)-binding protein [Candidatus Sulfobium sp.]
MYDRSVPFEAVIKWIKKETRDTATYALKIRSSEIQKAYSFKPGQFNMLYLDVIGLRGPFGTGWPMEEAEDRDLMIIAGGVGIAPLRSVIRHVYMSRKSCPGRDVILYGVKTPKDMIYRDEFPRYRDVFQVFLTVDKADPEEYWRGEVGLVTRLMDKAAFNPLGTTVFICGPEIMMQVTIRELLLRGVPGEKIFLSMERNMNCGMGICGHCFFGPKFVCRDGAVFKYTDIEEFMGIKEV